MRRKRSAFVDTWSQVPLIASWREPDLYSTPSSQPSKEEDGEGGSSVLTISDLMDLPPYVLPSTNDATGTRHETKGQILARLWRQRGEADTAARHVEQRPAARERGRRDPRGHPTKRGRSWDGDIFSAIGGPAVALSVHPAQSHRDEHLLRPDADSRRPHARKRAGGLLLLLQPLSAQASRDRS
jgi:hypothetical protein